MNENKRYEKRMNFNIILLDERCFKNEYCIVDKAIDRHEALSIDEIVYRLNDQEYEIKRLKDELFETRKEYILDTCDISDKLYLDEMIEEEREEIYGDVDGKIP